jgi:hypothetical protein
LNKFLLLKKETLMGLGHEMELVVFELQLGGRTVPYLGADNHRVAVDNCREVLLCLNIITAISTLLNIASPIRFL